MACKNEQCRCRRFCEVKSTETIDCQKCEHHKIITVWWHDKINGLRDKDDDDYMEDVYFTALYEEEGDDE